METISILAYITVFTSLISGYTIHKWIEVCQDKITTKFIHRIGINIVLFFHTFNYKFYKFFNTSLGIHFLYRHNIHKFIGGKL